MCVCVCFQFFDKILWAKKLRVGSEGVYYKIWVVGPLENELTIGREIALKAYNTLVE